MNLITDGFIAHAQHQPQKPAIVLRQCAQINQTCTYGELLHGATQVAAAIASSVNALNQPPHHPSNHPFHHPFHQQSQQLNQPQPQPQTPDPCSDPLNGSVCVGLLLPNSIEFLEVFLGVAIAGGVAMVLDPKWTPTQIQQAIHRWTPAVVVVDAAYSSAIELAKLTDGQTLVVVSSPGSDSDSNNKTPALSVEHPQVWSYPKWRTQCVSA